MSWNPTSITRKCVFISWWNCFIHMSNRKINKKSFLFKVKCRIVQGLIDNAARRTRRIISYWTWANWIKCAVWMQWSSSDTQCIQIKHYLELFSVSQRGLAGSANTDTALNWAFRISRMNSLYTLNEFKHAPATINHSHVHRCTEFISRPHQVWCCKN